MKGMKAKERPWKRYGLAVLLAALAFLTISDLVSDPSAWNWSKLVVLAVAGPFIWYGESRPRTSPEKIGPEAVPAEDVDAVVAESGRTVHAIKALREMHPGLGLRDAKNLVQPDH
ncbi:hypothetical protein R4P47_11170 [Rhodococcus sp. IEGM 1370]|uniref:hypothetical protein n=2 Tax=unclassified Rhodococcus (in: high G+C Gram-positive bacteria) TaxID=192944 RepID=UPI00295375C9|nr:hypothetical protein [Rhodococcus sp. IEGM 1370]MDV8077120.1 hypothetical protein [Rhodococcus sp. IEGM 1370]